MSTRFTHGPRLMFAHVCAHRRLESVAPPCWVQLARYVSLLAITGVTKTAAHQLLNLPSSHTAFSSTLFVIWQVIAGPDAPSLSTEQLRFLLQNYVPFALVPLMMLIDLTIRCTVALAYAQCKLATTIRSDKKTS